jgi:hypothetical protein
MGALLGVVALTAAIILGLRALQQRAVEQAQAGRSPATAIAIHDYAEIDIAVRLLSCRCGGHFALRGEGPARQPNLRVAQLECRKCEREQRLYFDLSTLRH